MRRPSAKTGMVDSVDRGNHGLIRRRLAASAASVSRSSTRASRSLTSALASQPRSSFAFMPAIVTILELDAGLARAR